VVVALAGAGALSLAGDGGTWTAGDARPGPTFDPREVADPASLPRLESVECRFAAPPWQEVTCHDLLVPQVRGDPAKGIVRLHVAVYASWSDAPEEEPVLFLTGGPGSAALLDFEDFSLYPFLEDRDLIVFDQRGTGASVPSLDCGEVDALAGDEGLASSLALGMCRSRLVREGVVLGAYTSAESAHDVADLRSALGVLEWDLYGISYGTRLALTVMRDHPAGIRSAILDGVYPLQADLYAEGAANAHRAFEALFGACETDTSCSTAHPQLAARYYAFLERALRAPFTVTGESSGEWTVDHEVLIDYLYDRLYLTHVIPSLPAAIDGILAGEMEPLIAFLEEGSWQGIDDRAWDDIAEGMYLSVQCHDEVPFYDAALAAGEEAGIAPEIVLSFEVESIQAGCRFWDVPRAGPVENEPVVSDVPTLLLSGEFDPITPPSWASRAAGTLANAHGLVFPGGHGVLTEFPCAGSVAMAFLDDPSRLVDGCHAGIGRPRFDP
jgi:pimeloyl-ACP methyl ester carboxylesterase